MDEKLLRKIKKFSDNSGNIELANFETFLDISDKLDKVTEAIKSIPQPPEVVIPETIIPEQKDVVFPEIQKVELVNPPKEKDDKEQLKLLKQIADELKKKRTTPTILKLTLH